MAYLKDPHFKESRDVIAERRERFERLNEEANLFGAWLISTPGNKAVIAETLADSPWPAILRKRFASFEEIGPGQRILPHAVVTRFTRNVDGTLAPLAEGSTAAVTTTFTGAGIAKTKLWGFEIP
jgi:hypothetical protein